MNARFCYSNLACLILILLPAQAVLAQEQAPAPPRVIMAVDVEVKPDMTYQYEEYVRKLREAFQTKHPSVKWSTFALFAGVEGERYSFVLSFDKWAGMDDLFATGGPDAVLIEAFGQEEGQRIVAMGVECVKTSSTSFWLERADLSNQ